MNNYPSYPLKKHLIVKPLAHLFTIWAFYLVPLNSGAQTIKERFDKLLVSENFDSVSSSWVTMANAENLFIVQDGEYILQRKSPTAPYAIIANFDEIFNNFRVVTSLKLDKTLSETGFAGLLFMMQAEGQGGFLIEFNKLKEYRLRQIVNGSYKYITGNSKSGGWIKNNDLNETGTANMIEIRSLNRNYDLFINNNFVQSFTEPAYRSGTMGVIIGPATRCKVDFMYVFSKTSTEELVATASTQTENIESPSEAGADIIELAESIIKLKTHNNKLIEENEGLRKTISAMNSGDQEKDVTLKNSEKQIKTFQEQISKKEFSIDSLIKKNNDLMKFKEMAGGNENGDIIIALSKNLKTEKEKNALLEKELSALKEKNGADKSPSVKNNNKNTKQDSGNTGSRDSLKKDTTIFKLPIEN